MSKRRRWNIFGLISWSVVRIKSRSDINLIKILLASTTNKSSAKSANLRPTSVTNLKYRRCRSDVSIIAGLLVCISSVCAQSPGDTLTPLRVVEKYVSPNGFPEKMRHFCCEMYQEWMAPKTLGQQLDSTVIRDIHLLYQDTARAVVTVWLHNEKTSMDVYFYLQHRQVWTVYAVRSLVMKDLAKDELKRLDSIPQKERGKTYTKQHGHSWQFDSDNAMLWSAPDTILANHFHLTKARFEQLEKMRAKMYMVSPTDSIDSTYFTSKKMHKAMDKLLIRAIRSDRNAPGSILYLIGGVLDNTVGYMYQPDPKKVPQVSAGYFILIRPLGGGWYLYKTT